MDDDNNIGEPQRPKRPLTAYNLYFQEERQRILNAIPDAPRRIESSKKLAARKPHGKIGFAELARDVAGKWRLLSDADRRPYDERAAVEKDRYRREMLQWRQAKKAGEAKEEAAAAAAWAAQDQNLHTALGAPSFNLRDLSGLQYGALAQPPIQQSTVPDYAATGSSSTLGIDEPSFRNSGPSIHRPLLDRLLASQVGASGSRPLPDSVLGQLATYRHVQGNMIQRPTPMGGSQVPSAYDSRILEQPQSLPFHPVPITNVFDDVDAPPQEQSQGEQNPTNEHTSLQGFLDGIDDETRNHFMRSMFNRPPQPPPPR